MAYNESQQPRFSQSIARLHDVKGNPAPQITPEISHGVTLEQTDFATELAALIGRRNCFAGITAPAAGAGISSGAILVPGQNIICVITGVQVNKATAGFVSVQLSDVGFPFGGTTLASFTFFRDSRLGPMLTARPATTAATRATGALPAAVVVKRVQVAAGIWTQVPIAPGIVIVNPLATALNRFGVFNETLNEAVDVMVDFYERVASPSEIVLPQ